MSRYDLTAERLRAVLDYDPETGIFTWKQTLSQRRQAGQRAGYTARNGYIEIGIDGISHWAHRLAWLHFYGCWPTKKVDHKDGNPSHNWITNLRDIAHQANIQNQRRPSINNKTGFLGVYKDGRALKNDRFIAKIQVGYRSVWIGTFATPEEAHAAYLEAKRKLHVGCLI